MITSEEKKYLGELAKEVYETSKDPANNIKRKIWADHNSLCGTTPPVFISPDHSWTELIPSLVCQDEFAKEMEVELRKRLIRYHILQDDVPITNIYKINKSVITINEGWGLVPDRVFSKEEGGAWSYNPVVKTPSDWKKLKHPSIDIDLCEHENKIKIAKDVLGNWLDIESCGITGFDFHMMHLYCDLRGIGEMMMDLVLNPNMVHDVISFITEGYKGILKTCKKENLFSLNNDDAYHYTGGIGYCRELNKTKKDKISQADVWGAAEAQEFAQVSPEMHEEFILKYERDLLDGFGLNGYGCCEDLTDKMDYVLKIPNLRRISICPWANIEKCADKLKKDYIMSWKPQPSYFCNKHFDEKFIENYLITEMQKAKHGYIEIVLRDTHTCFNQPERFTIFTKIAKRAIKQVYN